MRLTYQDAINRIKTVANAHAKIYSVDDGRELEFDVKKKNLFPRFFIKTTSAPVIGGQGTVELAVDFTVLLVDRLNIERTNVIEVMSNTHEYMTAVLATLNKEQVIRVTDNPSMRPLYDYHDSQVAGWEIIGLRVYLESGFTCYEVD